MVSVTFGGSAIDAGGHPALLPFNALHMFAGFESNQIRSCNREGKVVANAKGSAPGTESVGMGRCDAEPPRSSATSK